MKKTHEEYISELMIKNPIIEPMEKYIDARTAIMHHCKKHDIYWKAYPCNTLKGKGCCECGKEKNKIKFTKTHEKYVEQLRKSNPDVEVLENYKDSHTPILHLCKKHNVEWKSIPSNVLRGAGCPKCGSEKISDSLSKSHEWYVEKLKCHNPYLKVIEEYAGIDTHIKHYCTKHNEYWDTTPNNALKSCGCPKCKSEKRREALGMTHEDYVKEISIKRPDIEVIGKYINLKTKITHRCLNHDFLWDTTPNNILKGCGCPKCKSTKISGKLVLSHGEYVEKLKITNPNIVVIDKYININTQILHKCTIHDFEWNITPASVLQGCGCPKCRSEKIGNSLRKTHDQYIKEVRLINHSILVLGKYIDAVTPILHKCLNDGHEWYAYPYNILSGCGCPICKESKGERTIRILLSNHNIEYIRQASFEDCRDKKPLPFDFYLPTYNSCIEYDGEQHYIAIDYFGGEEYLKYIQYHDKIKNEYCKNNGISLLRIPYYKCDDIEEELNNFLFI